VVITRHGRLVYERYFARKDWRQSMSIGDVNFGMPLGVVSFGAATKHDMRSVSKSVTSLLVGIAFDRGLLTDFDTHVFSFFPEYEELRTPEKDRITLRPSADDVVRPRLERDGRAIHRSIEYLCADGASTPRRPLRPGAATHGTAWR